MDRHNIVKAFLSGLDLKILRQWTEADAGRFIASPLILKPGQYDVQELTREYQAQYPQLYADVSTITWVIPRTAFYDYLESLVRAGLGKRLMFGSDATHRALAASRDA
jgi:hypothetical protein